MVARFWFLIFITSKILWAQDAPQPIVTDLMTPLILGGAGFAIKGISFLKRQDSIVAHLPDGIGDYCLNWIKLNRTEPVDPPSNKVYNYFYRSVLCRPVEGKCPNKVNCAMTFRGKSPHPRPKYIELPKNGLKFKKGGLTYTYEPEVEIEKKDEHGVYDRGVYRKEKFAALYNLETKMGQSFFFCSIPVAVESDGTEVPAKSHDVLTCRADEKTHTCPGIEGCLDPANKIESHAATMATVLPASNATSGLALVPHAPRSLIEPTGRTHF